MIASGIRFAPAEQITRENVGQLKVAWTYHTEQFGDRLYAAIGAGRVDAARMAFEQNAA